MDQNIMEYRQKVAELAEQLSLHDPELREKFAGVSLGGVLAGREYRRTMDDLMEVPLVQESVEAVGHALG